MKERGMKLWNFLKKMKAESAARDMVSQLLTEAILGSDAPEDAKMDVCIIQTMGQIGTEVRSLVEKITLAEEGTYSVQNKKDVQEYLLLVAEGVKNFMSTFDEQITNKDEN